MEKDYLSRTSTEDARVEKEVAAAAAKTEAAAAAKKASQEAMKASIAAHMAHTRERALAAARAARDDGAADDAVFRAKLAALAEQEARDARARRARAADNKESQLAMMADKKRTLVAWGSVDASDARAADSAALGGPLDAVFVAEKDALRAQMVAKVGVRGGMAVDRLVHKLTHRTFA